MRRSCRRPPRASCRARGVLTLVALAVLLVGPWSERLSAQGAAGFPACITTQVQAHIAASGATTDRYSFEDPDVLLRAVWLCAGDYAVANILPIGRALLGGLVVIMVVWTGIGFMFSGQLDFGALLGTIFLAGLGFLMLDNYFFASPAAVPWLPAGQTSNGLVALFADEAVETGELIMGNAQTDFHDAFTDARVAAEERYLGTAARVVGDPTQTTADQVRNPWSDEGIQAQLRRFAFEVRMAPVVFMQWGTSVLMWLIGWMIYAQYVWGFFTLTVLTMLGPLFIPFMMIKQLDFLFWGWLKALLNGVIYMLTAAALYAVTAMVMIAPLDRMAEVLVPDDPGSFLGSVELLFRLTVEYVPLVIMSLFAALKVGALSGMVMSGGTPPGSGIGSALTKAESGARTLAGRYGAPPRSPAPLSQATAGAGGTARRRAAEALRDARRRSGGGGGGSRPGAGGGGRAG